MTREEVAMWAIYAVNKYDESNFELDDYRPDAQAAVAALDAHDAANNVHRVVIDDATVERVMGVVSHDWPFYDYEPEEVGRMVFAVLEAAAQEGQ